MQIAPHWIHLAAAIVCEVAATSALRASQGFTRPGPTIFVIAGYMIAFYFLSLTLRVLPVGVAYAIWSGVGVSLIALAGLLVLGQRLDPAAIVGIALIVTGVVVMNVFSQAVPH